MTWRAQAATRTGSLDTPFTRRVLRRTLLGVYALVALIVDVRLLAPYVTDPSHLFGDGALYWQATETWLRGGDPWRVVSVEGVRFAGIPPTLPLNVPLQSFGVAIASPFWGFVGLLAWSLVTWRAGRSALWIALFPPFWEAWLPGSPDPALFALTLVGGGFLAGFSKPYSVPGMLAAGRGWAVGAAFGLALLTAPFLPWPMFSAELPTVTATLGAQSAHSSAFGDWPLFAAAAVALASLGLRRGLAMAVPALLPNAQLHYSLFSLEVAARSAALMLILGVPGLAAPGIVVYAAVVHLRRMIGRRRAAGSAAGRQPALAEVVAIDAPPSAGSAGDALRH